MNCTTIAKMFYETNKFEGEIVKKERQHWISTIWNDIDMCRKKVDVWLKKISTIQLKGYCYLLNGRLLTIQLDATTGLSRSFVYITKEEKEKKINQEKMKRSGIGLNKQWWKISLITQETTK